MRLQATDKLPTVVVGGWLCGWGGVLGGGGGGGVWRWGAGGGGRGAGGGGVGGGAGGGGGEGEGLKPKRRTYLPPLLFFGGK